MVELIPGVTRKDIKERSMTKREVKQSNYSTNQSYLTEIIIRESQHKYPAGDTYRKFPVERFFRKNLCLIRVKPANRIII